MTASELLFSTWRTPSNWLGQVQALRDQHLICFSNKETISSCWRIVKNISSFPSVFIGTIDSQNQELEHQSRLCRDFLTLIHKLLIRCNNNRMLKININVLKTYFINISLNPRISDQDPHQIYETGELSSGHTIISMWDKKNFHFYRLVTFPIPYECYLLLIMWVSEVGKRCFLEAGLSQLKKILPI